jgi:hypothetical protein
MFDLIYKSKIFKTNDKCKKAVDDLKRIFKNPKSELINVFQLDGDANSYDIEHAISNVFFKSKVVFFFELLIRSEYDYFFF